MSHCKRVLSHLMSAASEIVKGRCQMPLCVTFRRIFMQSSLTNQSQINVYYIIYNYDTYLYFFIEESSSAKNVPRHRHDDIFDDVLVVYLLYVTTSQIIFSLNSSLDSPHLISEARDESRHRRPYRHRRSHHRRWSYRRGNLSETDSRSSRLRGSMLLPNSTKVGDRQ